MILSRDDGAQSNIDFLFGLAVFLMAFLYIFTFIPGLFVPYQASAVDLSAVAYKTSAMLVEDPGWYIYAADDVQMGNPAWETQDISHLARIGLAMDRSTPNVLSLAKVEALAGIGQYELIRDKIGLNGTLTYNFSLGLVMDNTLAGRRDTLLNITTRPMGDSVEYIDRNVLINLGRQLMVDGRNVSDISSLLQVRLTEMQVDDFENVTFRIFNTSGPGTIDQVLWKTNRADLPVRLVYKNQFIVRKNGRDVPALPVSFGPGDTMEIVVYNSEIRHLNMNYIWATSASNVFPNGEIDYYHDPVILLHSVCNPGIFKVEVWANEFV